MLTHLNIISLIEANFLLLQKIKETKQFWIQLPYQFCNNLSLSFNITEQDDCYNGTSAYVGQTSKNDSETSSVVAWQKYTLNDLTDKLKKAYQGQEVEMVDDTGKYSSI